MAKTLYILSFISDENYFENHFELTQTEHDQLWRRLSAANDALPYEDRVGDLQLFAPIETHTSAGHLVDTIASALDRDVEALIERVDAGETLSDEDQALVTLTKQADALDQAAERADRVTFGFDFVWNNGGGDDNAFSQGFTVAPEQQQEAWTFVSGLADWIETHGHGYQTNPGIEGDFEPSSLEEGLADLAESMDDLGADAWAQVLRDAIIPEPTSPAVAPATPTRPRSRLR